MAGQLESDGKVLFGAAGSVTVGYEVQCEFEIESSGSETSIEIEFSWKGAAAKPPATGEESGEDEKSGEADAVEDSSAEDEKSGEADAVEDSAAEDEEPGETGEADAVESTENGAAEEQPAAVGSVGAPAATSTVFASSADLSSFTPSTPAAEPASSAEEETGGHAGTTSTQR
jgi:hypothetical protein